MYHHELINARGGVHSSDWFAVEFAAPDRSKACATVVRLGPGDDVTYIFRPRGLSPAKTYRVTFDSLGETLLVEGLRLIREGLPLRLESTAASELLLFEAMAPEETE